VAVTVKVGSLKLRSAIHNDASGRVSGC